MPKSKSVYICSACGAESGQWYGKCPSCNTYNSLEESFLLPATNINRGGWQSNSHSHPQSVTTGKTKPRSALKFSEISDNVQVRFPSGYSEFDRVLGGGVVPGSLVLIGGDPGIGKSTLLLQVAHKIATEHCVLYVSAEESGQQVKIRASRLGVCEKPLDVNNIKKKRGNVAGNGKGQTPDEDGNNSGNDSKVSQLNDADLYVLAETDLEEILRELESLRPQAAIIDSIQTIYLASLASAPGSVAQVRECTSALMRVAKRANITLLIVGHVTKEGAIAGPRVLEHLVDTVLYFEGDRFASHRLLRSVKNRFGATHEIGIFEMADKGLEEVLNPSELFLGNRDEMSPGTATVVACEGTRPILVELQALVAPASYGAPRRSTTGIDYSRLQQILAVLEKRVGIPLSKLDAYVATAGGLAVEEPATDLGVAIAVVASFRDRVVDPRTVMIGEVGLGGQVRLVSQMELRLKEAAKLGFKRAIIPKGQALPDLGLEIVPVARVLDAIIAALPGGLRQNEDEDEDDE
ncbi:MAG TPA: DNA repair protein RadA [Cyanobacteria bacterium UBA11149]|nr:DNA repair protein RadA [Cyanobacteria bacterium UBA11367]HBE57689.1 DNA repair protein RadA [Cyanobacteria bacterium UBA11366]HBK64572.1 DNA repair protein RadA [Cyanobacteria bacterium UBA11166]HBR74733.1 DNA repair protein RadA [Cyanobacteria bacterium UBA11159]HBS69686.1 DNA repair protein RadA [Cyanobacteria bacterium UBA11153]HBW87969.1 DNA repair protein RadA [Cyanobacteria bacterium UBA11149]HCA95321.1 DNA repair protein RadA [Cyanobacteria bacterium UBA9226]